MMESDLAWIHSISWTIVSEIKMLGKSQQQADVFSPGTSARIVDSSKDFLEY